MTQQPEPTSTAAGSSTDHQLAPGPARLLALAAAALVVVVYILGFFDELTFTGGLAGALIIGGGLLAGAAVLPRTGRVLLPAAVLLVTGTLQLLQGVGGALGQEFGGPSAVQVVGLVLAFLAAAAAVGALLLDAGLVKAPARRPSTPSTPQYGGGQYGGGYGQPGQQPGYGGQYGSGYGQPGQQPGYGGQYGGGFGQPGQQPGYGGPSTGGLPVSPPAPGYGAGYGQAPGYGGPGYAAGYGAAPGGQPADPAQGSSEATAAMPAPGAGESGRYAGPEVSSSASTPASGSPVQPADGGPHGAHSAPAAAEQHREPGQETADETRFITPGDQSRPG